MPQAYRTRPTLAKAVAKPMQTPAQAGPQPQLALVALPSVEEGYYRLDVGQRVAGGNSLATV